MEETYLIEDLEQLRAISDQLRVEILHVLRDQAMTTKQLGDRLGMAPAKVHYHVRELERVGLVRLVETREKGGILEKYYQPIARSFNVSGKILLSSPPHEVLASLGSMVDQSRDKFLNHLSRAMERRDDQTSMLLRWVRFRATYEEQKRVYEQIFELLRPFEERDDDGEGEVLQGMFMLYPNYDEHAGSQDENHQPDTAGTTRVVSSQVVGVVHYSRAELEQLVDEGKRLRLSVVGTCLFDADIEPELVGQVVEKLTLVGTIQATPAVAEVLEQKRS
ncbi:hypothetical protein KDH_72420 [Dictyobacter sp. S3.2.2.5]|uniref:HTH arsR-type domain-containing protein n=1 Tax=Dictyobacter halimunensis TaxID=3026934 RepID=A0ABQ6G3M6_9CHLR|nr:hypothetical protein KDH_72420 [Dictyobacter sp. S3.2.2.5]